MFLNEMERGRCQNLGKWKGVIESGRGSPEVVGGVKIREKDRGSAKVIGGSTAVVKCIQKW